MAAPLSDSAEGDDHDTQVAVVASDLFGTHAYRGVAPKDTKLSSARNEESPPVSPKPDGTLIGQRMESASLAQTETTQPPQTSTGHLMPSPPRGEAPRSRPKLSSYLVHDRHYE